MSRKKTDSSKKFLKQFEKRKRDHIKLALEKGQQAVESRDFDRIEILHDALPEINFNEVSLNIKSLGRECQTPFFVSSMTAGHKGGVDINQRLAKACEEMGWRLGVGSQRRELSDANAQKEWKKIRKASPRAKFMGNLGLAQLIHSSKSDIDRLIENLEPEAFIIHLNPLQECLQGEGTPEFRGGVDAIQNLCETIKIPVIVKETGCGFSHIALKKLKKTKIAALDVAGLGGTHWGRVEAARLDETDLKSRSGIVFGNWGHGTVESVLAAQETGLNCEIWGSGGVRSGLDAAKLIALGANQVGIAMPMMVAAQKGVESIVNLMKSFEFELKTALFCTGQRTMTDMQQAKVWRWTQAK